MKPYRAFIPTGLLVALAAWPFAVHPMTRTSTVWAFYLTIPLALIAFVALVAGIVSRRKPN